MVEKAWKLTVPLFLLSLSGAYVSYLLMEKHVLGAHGPGWFAAMCGEEASAPDEEAAGDEAPAEQDARESGASTPAAASGGANCAAVLASRWATIPPHAPEQDLLPDEAGAEQPKFRVPTAYLGFVYFTALTIWFLFVGRPTPDRFEWYALALAFVVAGACSSVFFLVIMLTQGEEWCPWCLVSHVLNFLILGGVILLRPKRVIHPAAAAERFILDRTAVKQETGPKPAASEPPEPAKGPGGSTDEERAIPLPKAEAEPVRPHPSARLAMACILLAAATSAMFWNGFAVAVTEKKAEAFNAAAKEQLNYFHSQARFLAQIYANSPMVTIPLRPDDPQLGDEEKLPCNLVVFSDFECSYCKGFASFVEKQLQKWFAGRLRLIWKHYPLATECNNAVRFNTHPNSCEAARAAEAARLQGGNEAFWKAHDVLFAAQGRLKNFDFRALAEELGLDPDRFAQDMHSPAVTERIAEDVALAKSLGVTGTPAIFLSGRRVEGKLVWIMPFWMEMAKRFNDKYDQKIAAEKEKQWQAKQKGKAAATQPATPDTPDPAAAPSPPASPPASTPAPR